MGHGARNTARRARREVGRDERDAAGGQQVNGGIRKLENSGIGKLVEEVRGRRSEVGSQMTDVRWQTTDNAHRLHFDEFPNSLIF